MIEDIRPWKYFKPDNWLSLVNVAAHNKQISLIIIFMTLALLTIATNTLTWYFTSHKLNFWFWVSLEIVFVFINISLAAQCVRIIFKNVSDDLEEYFNIYLKEQEAESIVKRVYLFHYIGEKEHIDDEKLGSDIYLYLIKFIGKEKLQELINNEKAKQQKR